MIFITKNLIISHTVTINDFNMFKMKEMAQDKFI